MVDLRGADRAANLGDRVGAVHVLAFEANVRVAEEPFVRVGEPRDPDEIEDVQVRDVGDFHSPETTPNGSPSGQENMRKIRYFFAP